MSTRVWTAGIVFISLLREMNFQSLHMEVVTSASWGTWISKFPHSRDKGLFSFHRLVMVYTDSQFGDTSLDIFVRGLLD